MPIFPVKYIKTMDTKTAEDLDRDQVLAVCMTPLEVWWGTLICENLRYSDITVIWALKSLKATMVCYPLQEIIELFQKCFKGQRSIGVLFAILSLTLFVSLTFKEKIDY